MISPKITPGLANPVLAPKGRTPVLSAPPFMSPVRPLQFPSLHPAQLRPLRTRLRASIRDAGLTDFGVTAGPAGLPFWELEPTPLVIEAPEWALLEAALHQRAHYINALLVDLYGSQQALHQGIIPPELVLANP